MRPLAELCRPLCGALFLVFLVGHDASAQRTLPAWTRGAVCYEIFVRSFFDSDGDGIGDFRGLTQKLDYINDGNPATQRDLGARCLWLMPVMPSPSYHGYDATDYYRVNPEYGTEDDFKRFVAAAHSRGIRVLIDMVLNHASSEHPYFKEALLDPESPYRAWWRFAATPQGQGPWGNVAWHKNPYRDEYYYGVFWHGMPDLNYAHPPVREEAKKVATFWLREMGVDGFRLDAIPYLVEEGGRLAGTPATHAFFREYAAHIRSVAPESYTVGEVWDSVGAMLPYYPDQLDSHFAFELSNAIVNSVRGGNGKDLFAGYLRLQTALPAERWSPFLRNHDQTRTATEFKGNIARQKLAATLLLTLPGLPFVYYGEEIGMTGDKPDPRLRTPMHWTAGRAAGFTSGQPWEPLQPDSNTVTVAAQDADPGSLLNHFRRLIHLRSEKPALANGMLIPLETSDSSVVAYVRTDSARPVLVIANLAEAPKTGVRVSSRLSGLAPGRHLATDLLGGTSGQRLSVGRGGILAAQVPVPTLAALQAYVFELERRP
ncbi:MAG: alpha-amylase family glycosyl hydrolase [Gemmatimonadaceae bacterium]